MWIVIFIDSTRVNTENYEILVLGLNLDWGGISFK